jgi:hypothetical protein
LTNDFQELKDLSVNTGEAVNLWDGEAMARILDQLYF